MSRKKINTTVYFTAEQVERLKVLSMHTRIPQAEIIRWGLDWALDKLERERQEVPAFRPPSVADVEPSPPRPRTFPIASVPSSDSGEEP